MPGRDGTGPAGRGAMTGWGLGPCGQGLGQGAGRGAGRGLAQGAGRGAGRGLGRGVRAGYQYRGAGRQGALADVSAAYPDETAQRLARLEEAMDEVLARLDQPKVTG